MTTWRCLLCDRHGPGAGPAYTAHWRSEHGAADQRRAYELRALEPQAARPDPMTGRRLFIAARDALRDVR